MQTTTHDRDQYWQQIRTHTFARNSAGTPWAVQRHVAALLGNHDIVESLVAYNPTGPSSWSILLVTEDAQLIKFHIEFDEAQYDLDEEQRPHRQKSPAVGKVREAWIRRLSDVVRLDIRQVTDRVGAFGDRVSGQVNVGDVHLTFSDGAVEDLEIDQAAMSSDDIGNADAFISALRDATKV